MEGLRWDFYDLQIVKRKSKRSISDVFSVKSDSSSIHCGLYVIIVEERLAEYFVTIKEIRYGSWRIFLKFRMQNTREFYYKT